jgi:L-threonylcarbamoyladenylate synthase
MNSRTLILQAESDQQAVEQAAEILRGGGTVAFATETVYGLGANALDAHAVAKIFTAKQRPAWDPLIVHIAGVEMLEQVAACVPPAAEAWIASFWPGPLTLLLPRAPGIPDAVTSGRPLVGVRLPAHPVARALIRAAGVPVAAPSANTFGHVSPTTAAHVAADLDGRIDAILDCGPTLHGVESTVVDASGETCILYRPGAVTLEQLRSVWPATEPYREVSDGRKGGEPESLPSPGVGIRHYAPRARLVLVDPAAGAILSALAEWENRGKRVGLMLPAGIDLSAPSAAVTYEWGAWDEPEQLAQRLFAGLRELDDRGAEVILCPTPRAEGVGVAIRDRLLKAARQG